MQCPFRTPVPDPKKEKKKSKYCKEQQRAEQHDDFAVYNMN
jgi:hypothetical protein